MFNLLFKKTQRVESLSIDRCTTNLDKLIGLTARMDVIDKRRRKQEDFVEAVISSVDKKLLIRDQNGVFLFLTNEEAVKVMKIAVEKALMIVRS